MRSVWFGVVACIGCSFGSEGGGGAVTLGDATTTGESSGGTVDASTMSSSPPPVDGDGSTTAPPVTSADATGVDEATDGDDQPSDGNETDDPPIEICNGLDDDGDGFVDEWSEANERCGSCVYVVGIGFVYAFCDDPLPWLAADAFCATLGGRLTSIHDRVENELVWQHTGPQRRWIGFTDVAAEGVWVWADQTPSDFTAWNEGQPNNADGGEHCAVMLTDVPAWHDTECETAERFVCRAPA